MAYWSSTRQRHHDLISVILSSLSAASVGMNLFVINGISPDIRLTTILKGAFPFMLCMVLAIVILCVFPQIATWLPEQVMG